MSAINAERAAEIEAFMEVLVKQVLAVEEAQKGGDEAEAGRVGLEVANSLMRWTPIEHGAMTMALALGVGILNADKDKLEAKAKELEIEVAALNQIVDSLKLNESKDGQNV